MKTKKLIGKLMLFLLSFNLWIIWSVVFVFIILGGIIFDKFVSPFKKKSE